MSYQRQPPRTDGSGLAFRPANDLPEETRRPVVQQLNRSLADTTDVASQMKFAHWNVKGMQFYQLHLLFDEIAEVLTGHADMLAERATSLGGQAMGTVRMAAADSQIREISPSNVTGPEFVETTTEHLAVHAANLRAAIDFAANAGDEGTADLYTELSREVDQQLYFLESHLQADAAWAAERTGGARATGDTHQPEWTVQGPQQGPQSTSQGQQTPQGQQVPQWTRFDRAGQQGQPPLQGQQPPQGQDHHGGRTQ